MTPVLQMWAHGTVSLTLRCAGSQALYTLLYGAFAFSEDGSQLAILSDSKLNFFSLP
jgi:hypothetical protein